MLGAMDLVLGAVLPFTPEEAEIAASLWQSTRRYGLSLGDRACLSCGLDLGVPVFTTDKVWQKLKHAIQVRIVR
ncbi:MAG: twitching motility protein PilT [Gammaproteobacteria bacterium]|nr:twitching motility protein PilT [Gammaproteobacteria bacterium]